VPQLHPADAPLPRERSKAPYTAAEIGSCLALAAAQPTQARRTRAAGLVCLAAGAGPIRCDLSDVRGTDGIARSSGVILQVRGARERAVPLLAHHHEPLLTAAAFVGTELVTGGTDPARRNVTTRLASTLSGGSGLPRLDTSQRPTGHVLVGPGVRRYPFTILSPSTVVDRLDIFRALWTVVHVSRPGPTAGGQDRPDSDSQPKSELRRVTRNLILDFATLPGTDTTGCFSFLILVGRFATLDAWSIQASHPCTT
jgi:hypothetical protein